MLHPTRLFALLALFFASGSAFAGTITVGPAGSGADFPDIQAAVDASQPGDTILVAAGTYLGFELDKSLTILGAGSELTIVEASLTFGPLEAVRVHGLAAGDQTVVSGMKLFGDASQCPAPFPCNAIVELSNCQAPVVLHDIVILDDQPSSNPGLRILDCEAVYVSRVDYTGPMGATPFVGQIVPPEPAIEILDSNVSMTDCTVLGGDGSVGLGPEGQTAVCAENSSLYIGRSETRGGRGGAILLIGSPGLVGGPGIEARDSIVQLAGGPGSVVAGGDGGLPGATPSAVPGAGAPAIRLLGSSMLRYTLIDLLVAAGSTPGGPPAVQIEADASSSVRVELARSPTLSFTAGSVQPGSAVNVDALGEPGDVMALLFSIAVGPALELPGFDGPFVLSLAPLLTAQVFWLNGAGANSHTISVPATSNLVGLSLVYQGLEIDPSSNRFTNPAFVVIVP